MVHTFFFVLSEVLIAGLLGVEKVLSPLLHVPEETILPALGGAPVEDLFRGKVSEEYYLSQVLQEQALHKQGWNTSIDTLKEVIRKSFEHRVPGMEEVLSELGAKYELVLLSDHASEWIEHIREIHPFLEIFDRQIFSFETGQLKKEASTFHTLLQVINRKPEECLFEDDNPLNVKVARGVGIIGVKFTETQQLIGTLRSQEVLL
ncbi:MAG: HAD hydrolase-like protein [Anaerolineales bacterium]|nr:HAD hydrolase-like protein [Anaerolineales bacterium]